MLAVDIMAMHLTTGMLLLSPQGNPLGIIRSMVDLPAHPGQPVVLKKMVIESEGGRKQEIRAEQGTYCTISAIGLPATITCTVYIKAKNIRVGNRIGHPTVLPPRQRLIADLHEVETLHYFEVVTVSPRDAHTMQIRLKEPEPDALLDPTKEYKALPMIAPGIDLRFEIDPFSIEEYIMGRPTEDGVELPLGKLCGPFHIMVDLDLRVHVLVMPQFSDYTLIGDLNGEAPFAGLPEKAGLYECWCIPRDICEENEKEVIIFEVEKAEAFVAPSTVR
jgi:hypothetical protein